MPRGRIAAFAIGSHMASNRQRSADEYQMQQAQQTQDAQQREIERLKAEKASKPKEEDPTQKLEKLADLHKKGVLTDEEYSKLKAQLIAKM